MSPNRVDAIRGAEEERQTILANRTNPLDNELIKTKGLLRAPSLRDVKGERKKRLEEGDNAACPAGLGDKETGTQSPQHDNCNGVSRLNESTSLSLTPPHGKLEATCDVQSGGCSRPESTLAVITPSPNVNGHIDEYVSITLSRKSTTEYTTDTAVLTKSPKSVIPDTMCFPSPVTCNDEQSNGVVTRPRRTRDSTQRKENRSSVEIDSEARRNLLKDVENFKKRDSLTSPKRATNSGDCC